MPFSELRFQISIPQQPFTCVLTSNSEPWQAVERLKVPFRSVVIHVARQYSLACPMTESVSVLKVWNLFGRIPYILFYC